MVNAVYTADSSSPMPWHAATSRRDPARAVVTPTNMAEWLGWSDRQERLLLEGEKIEATHYFDRESGSLKPIPSETALLIASISNANVSTLKSLWKEVPSSVGAPPLGGFPSIPFTVSSTISMHGIDWFIREHAGFTYAFYRDGFGYHAYHAIFSVPAGSFSVVIARVALITLLLKPLLSSEE